jgi:hypothetical protein
MSANIMSLYIPYVPKVWDAASISWVFKYMEIGIVERVDFIDKGFWPWAHTAIVHLKSWYYNDYTDALYEAIECENGQWTMDLPGTSSYFILKKMLCAKIPATTMNLHQLAARLAQIEELLLKEEEEEDLVFDEEEDGNTDFIDKYDETEPLSMKDLVAQTQDYSVPLTTENLQQKSVDSPLDLDVYRSDGKRRTMWYNSEGLLEFDYDNDCESDRDYDELFEVRPEIPMIDRLRNSAELCGNN